MEIMDLYDENRLLTGETLERGTKCPPGQYRLVVHLALFRPSGEMLIQKRTADSPRFPGLWDISVGGAAQQGDTSQQAMERELAEELGLRQSFAHIRPAFTINFSEGYDDMYVMVKDISLEDLTLQPEEVVDARWATKEEIHQLIQEEVFIPYGKSLIDLLFFMRDHQGSFTFSRTDRSV